MEHVADEILLRIFSYLDTKDVITCCMVSKRFRRVTEDSAIYKNFNVDHNSCLSSGAYLNHLRKHHSRVEKLVFQDFFWLPSTKLAPTFARCKNLVELNVTGCKITSAGLLKILANNPGIKKLGWTISENVFSDEGHLESFKSAFKNLSSLILHFKTLRTFEIFLPVFDSKDLFVNEFGLHYLKSSSSNTYGIYVKTQDKFQLHLEDAAVTNRFLHFNLLIMDFVIQTVSKAAETKSITTLLARGNTICWRHIEPVLTTYTFEKIDLSLSVLAKDQMTWLSKLKKLEYVNVSQVGHFKSNLMKAIATNCPKLSALNLSNCEDWINKDLYGLEAVAQKCTNLRELNVSNLHIHSGDDQLNRLCSIIGEMKNLKKLSIPACSLVNNISIKQSPEKAGKKSMSSSPSWKAETFKPSSLLVSLDSSNPSFTASPSTSANNPSTTPEKTHPTTRLSRQLNDDETLVSAIGSGLDPIVKGCCGLEELEIVDVGFHSPFNRVVCDQFICPLTSNLRDRNFQEICKLKNLKKLTLAGLSGVGAFNSLVDITSACTKLESLSIAQCGLAGHSNALMHLKNALKNCKSLKHFRMDQPHFHIKEDLLEAFHGCYHLQTVTFINKNGKANKSLSSFVNLFNNCKFLVGFFLFSGITQTDCQRLQSTLMKKFGSSRPPLSVGILPYHMALKDDGISEKNVPYLFTRDIIYFESSIAVEKANGLLV